MDNERIPCKRCGALILPATFARNGGLCGLCGRGIEKETCDFCGNMVNGTIRLQDGRKRCLKCSMLVSHDTSCKWKALHNTESYPYDVENIRVKPYPAFEDVFENKELEGFFYPLCSVKLMEKATNQPVILHIVSHNGLWMEDTGSKDTFNNIYTRFSLVDNRYRFNDSLSVFKTIPDMNKAWSFLFGHFRKNVEKWLRKQTGFQDFMEEVSAVYESDTRGFDMEYFAETFYSYHLRREKYIRKYGYRDFVLQKELFPAGLFDPFLSDNFMNIAEELVVNNTELLMELIPVGVCWGDQYFHDGNNSFLFFDKVNGRACMVNQYS